MSQGLEPTEEYDGRVSVHTLKDDGTREREACQSYEDAIETARNRAHTATVVKIEDREGDVVFSSAEMDIDDWETEWRHAIRGFSVDVEDWECPYEDGACIPGDLCIQCEMDVMQDGI